MSEMIERVALEIQAAGYNPATAMDIARIAIKAMRAPTQAMIDGTGEPGVPDKYYADLWRAMIDEALK